MLKGAGWSGWEEHPRTSSEEHLGTTAHIPYEHPLLGLPCFNVCVLLFFSDAAVSCDPRPAVCIASCTPAPRADAAVTAAAQLESLRSGSADGGVGLRCCSRGEAVCSFEVALPRVPAVQDWHAGCWLGSAHAAV